MQNITRNYNCVSTWFYNFYRRWGTNCPRMPYQAYLFNIATINLPKLAYEHNFEPEYTRPAVKYNAPIVLTMIGVTLVLARKTVEDEENSNKTNQ